MDNIPYGYDLEGKFDCGKTFGSRSGIIKEVKEIVEVSEKDKEEALEGLKELEENFNKGYCDYISYREMKANLTSIINGKFNFRNL